MMRKVLILILCLLVAFVSGRSRPKADRVSYLPGFHHPFGFEVYSGYLEGQTENTQLHYVFVEAETNPSVAPLVLWLNGGPGCSSLLGMLTENGPFLSRPGNRLIRNKFSWNQHANMLYLEAPAGVGFSFARDGNVKTDDDKVADNNFAALGHFFEKFPEFKGRDFYIVGESYGGIYVPTLALRVVKHPEMELKGIAVDNGLTSYVLNDNSLIYFAYYHSLIDASLWQDLVKFCCGGKPTDRCLFTLNPNPKCQDAVLQASNIILYGLNMYNLYAPCDGGVPPSGTIAGKQLSHQTLTQNVVAWRRILQYNRHSRHEYHHRRVLSITMKPERRQSSKFTREHTDRGNLFRLPISDDKVKLGDKLEIVCSNDSVIEGYLNQAEVRETLHIPKTVHDWAACDADVYSNYSRVYLDLSPQYMELLNKNVRTHIFNGDVDMACNSIGDEWFVNDLGLNVTNPRRAWFYTAVDGTRQIGGYTKTFTHPAKQTNLTFSTVRGAGHMVPKDKPVPGFTLFVNFLNNVDH